jgi:hypothetical protein
MTTGLLFHTAGPPAQPAPNRADIACFVGFVPRRRGAPLRKTVKNELAASGWIGGPWQPKKPEDLDSLLQVPVPVESWEAFDELYAWDERPLRTTDKSACTTYLGAAVRSFFAHGGRRALIVRSGDPWVYLPPAVAGDEEKRERIRVRIRALVPSFADAGAPGALFDPTDPTTWRGIHHLYGLPDVSMVLLPDLADACAVDPQPPAGRRDPPAQPEGFVACSEGEPLPPDDRGLIRVAAPRCDSSGYGAWRIAVAEVRAFLARHRRDCMLVGALPLAIDEAKRPSYAGPIFAEDELLAFLRRAQVLEPEAAKAAPKPEPSEHLRSVDGLELDRQDEPPRQSAASTFIQLGWPWIATRGSSDLPETLEPPDGLLAGVIAASAISRGTFRSVAGTRLHQVLGATPAPSWGAGPDSPAMRLAERVCMIAPEPDGWTLVSDVTTSPVPTWRPGGTRRLMASILRAARRLGEGLLFEPNGPLVWTRLRRAIEELLTDYWREGALRGASSADAFDVRCDRSTMSQNDIDNGRLVAHIGVAPAASVETINVVLALDAGSTTALELREVA